MSRIRIWRESDPATVTLDTQEPSKIRDALAGIGVRFAQWPTARALPHDADEAAILAAYAADIAALKAEAGYAAADVVRLAAGAANTVAMRTKFLDEHTHAEDEVRFFVEGTGAFYLHAAGKVHQVVCCAGDLLGVPANMRHWFDMGEKPVFTAIRLFTNPEGWVAQFTGDAIARRFALFEGAP